MTTRRHSAQHALPTSNGWSTRWNSETGQGPVVVQCGRCGWDELFEADLEWAYRYVAARPHASMELHKFFPDLRVPGAPCDCGAWPYVHEHRRSLWEQPGPEVCPPMPTEPSRERWKERVSEVWSTVKADVP